MCVGGSLRVYIRRLVPAPCLFLEHPIDLLFEPLFVVWDVGGRGRLVNETAEIEKVVDELEELANVVRDGG
jgi:hypothetical protein